MKIASNIRPCDSVMRHSMRGSYSFTEIAPEVLRSPATPGQVKGCTSAAYRSLSLSLSLSLSEKEAHMVGLSLVAAVSHGNSRDGLHSVRRSPGGMPYTQAPSDSRPICRSGPEHCAAKRR